jgi:hypothetical protein
MSSCKGHIYKIRNFLGGGGRGLSFLYFPFRRCSLGGEGERAYIDTPVPHLNMLNPAAPNPTLN